MLNRPSMPREKRIERQSAADGNELDKGLNAAIKQSAEAISTQIKHLIQSRYKDLKKANDQNT